MRPSILERFLSLVLGFHLIKNIEVGTAIALMGGANLLGSLIGGNSAAKAQAATNASNERIANQTNQYNQNQYLLQRGFSTGSMPGIPVGPTNTVLPLWAQIGREPAEQYLFNQILNTARGSGVDVNDPGSFASINQVREYLASSPDDLAGIQAMLKETGDTRDPIQWLHDHVNTTEVDDGGGQFTTKLKAFAQERNAAQPSESALPAEYQALQDQVLGTVKHIYDGGFLTDEMNALAPALEARLRLGDLALERNTELRDKTKGIYDAELLRADTYAQAAQEAVNSVLAKNAARDAVRGFSGGSSMDDLTRARTLAPAIQAGAGARAQADVDYKTRLASILDAEAKTVGENAKIQNALDRLGLISGDITRRINSANMPGDLYQRQLGLESLTYNQKFRDLDSLISRLNNLSTGGMVQPSQAVVPNIQPVLGSGQILGSALSNLSSAGMDYFSTQALIKAMGSGSGLTTGAGGGSSSVPLFTGSNFNYTVGNFDATPALLGR